MHLRDDDKAKRAQLLLRHLLSQAIILIISTTALGELYSGRSETGLEDRNRLLPPHRDSPTPGEHHEDNEDDESDDDNDNDKRSWAIHCQYNLDTLLAKHRPKGGTDLEVPRIMTLSIWRCHQCAAGKNKLNEDTKCWNCHHTRCPDCIITRIRRGR